MEIKTGNIWDAWEDADLFLLAAHSTVKSGKLVMAGNGLEEAQRRFPKLSEALGQAILRKADRTVPNGLEYYLLVSDRWPAAKLGLLQTRYTVLESHNEFIAMPSLLDLVLWTIDHQDAEIHVEADPVLVAMFQGTLKNIPRVTLWVNEVVGEQ